MSYLKLSTLIIFLSGVFGCAILNSTKHDNDKAPPNQLAYFLPTGRLHLQAEKNASTDQCDIKIAEIYVPDRSKLYFLEYAPSVTSDDTVKVVIGTNGLLTQIDTTTKDQTPAIVSKLIEAARAGLGLPAPSVKTIAGRECKLDFTADPFTEKAQLLTALQGFDNTITNVTIDAIGTATFPQDAKDIARTGGVYYKPLLPYKFMILTNNVSVQPTTIVYLPNESPVLSLDISRAAFVENKILVNFKDGILENITWTKPSEALGFMSIPIDVAKAIASIPSELLTVNIKTDKELLDAQKQLIQAQIELITKQKELEALLKAAGN